MTDLRAGVSAIDDAIVFVVDDDASVRRSTERLVRTMGFGIQAFASAQEFLAGARVDRPGCLVLDVHMPGLSGLDLQRELADRGVELPIVFLTGHGDIPMTVRAMKAGAVEFLTKPVKSRELIAAIRSAIERGRVRHQARRESDLLHERHARLTAREREILPLIVAGLLNKQIAAELSMSERTVKFHRAHIMKKMEAETLAELVRVAERLGVAPDPRVRPVPEDR
jgi:FixJ family two-component response regulator